MAWMSPGGVEDPNVGVLPDRHPQSTRVESYIHKAAIKPQNSQRRGAKVNIYKANLLRPSTTIII